jgi:UPF0755 protein
MAARVENGRKQRRKRRNGLVAFGNALLSIIVLGIIAAAGIAYFGYQQYSAPGPAKADTAFLVDKDSGLSSVAVRLEDQGLISNNFIFSMAGRVLKKSGDLKPGQFIIPANASMSDVMEVLTETKPVEFFVTVPEGETSFRAAERIRLASNSLTGELTADPAEGTILPGRYDWTLPTETRQSVLDKMQAAMKSALDKAWAGRDTSIDDVVKTPEDLLTLASLVERETAVPSEHATVASVFINRMRKGMRLQTDPSVLYGITLGKTVLTRGPTSKELRAETPYNTYVITGLPPGPIANPSADTLNATAHPEKSNYLYFVAKTADPQQGHLFAATYADHRKNVAKYRQAVKAQEAADDAEAETAKEELAAEQAQAGGDTTQ